MKQLYSFFGSKSRAVNHQVAIVSDLGVIVKFEQNQHRE